MNIKKGKIITVTSQKGGVGKTTTSLGMASIYSNLKKKVLIIDLDLFTGSIAFALNLEYSKSIYNLCDDLFNNRIEDMSKYVTNYSEFVDVLAAPKDPRQSVKIDKKYIERILNNFVYLYDVIVIDSSHYLTPSNIISFSLSDKIINIVTNDAYDLKNTKNFVSLCKNMEVENLVLVLNESVKKENYFSMFDIKNIVKKNISYVIPSSFYIKNYDMYIMEGKLMEYFSKLKKNKDKTYLVFEKNLLKLLGSEDDAHEKK